MNILEIVSAKDVNGAVIHCLALCRALAARGHDVTLLCRPGAWVAEQIAPGDNVRVLLSSLDRWPLSELRRIARIARHELRIDVIHTHMTRAHHFGVFLRRLSGIPVVATAHSQRVQPQWLFNDKIISVSEATRRWHRTHNLVPSGRIETVHGFVDYERFAAPVTEAAAQVRASLNVAPGAPLVGLIGDVVPRKGQMVLVRALPKVLAAVPNVQAVIVGPPKGSSGYEAQARAEAGRLGVEGALIWAGYRSDVREIMAALDVYVLASFSEMFPVSLLEAMAAGLPVVATRQGGVPECVVDGESGLLVLPGDAGALADAVVRVLQMPLVERQAMGERARETVRTRFTLESQVPKIEAVLARVATGRTKAG